MTENLEAKMSEQRKKEIYAGIIQRLDDWRDGKIRGFDLMEHYGDYAFSIMSTDSKHAFFIKKKWVGNIGYCWLLYEKTRNQCFVVTENKERIPDTYDIISRIDIDENCQNPLKAAKKEYKRIIKELKRKK